MAKHKHPEKEKHTHALTLKIEKWKELFAEYEYKLMICRALNECVARGEFEVKGYLITAENTFLLIKIKEKESDHIIHQLERSLEDEIERTLKWLKNIATKETKEQYRREIRMVKGKLFQVYPMMNHTLVKLLKGELKEKAYHDPQVQKMMDLSVNDPFSSVKGYEGKHKKEGIGPVLMKNA